jgi:hypothetical protein
MSRFSLVLAIKVCLFNAAQSDPLSSARQRPRLGVEAGLLEGGDLGNYKRLRNLMDCSPPAEPGPHIQEIIRLLAIHFEPNRDRSILSGWTPNFAFFAFGHFEFHELKYGF